MYEMSNYDGSIYISVSRYLVPIKVHNINKFPKTPWVYPSLTSLLKVIAKKSGMSHAPILFQGQNEIFDDLMILLILFRAVPNLNMAVAASRNDTILLESYPAHGICVDDFGLERS